MNPGRELDALVAEKVMGWTDVMVGDPSSFEDPSEFIDEWMGRPGVEIYWASIPRFSTDISVAWEVAEKLLADGWRIKTTSSELGGTDVELVCNAGARGRYASDCCEGIVTAFPHAICLAALKAVGAL